MRRKIKLLPIIAAAILAAVSILGSVTKTFAASGDSLTATKGVYWFAPHEIDDRDLTDTYVYDDSLLMGDSLEYNQQLATMSYELAVASISSSREANTEEGYANKSRNLRAYLEDNGFIDFDTNQYYKQKMTTDTFGVACAHKTIVDNGTPYTLLVIAPRSAGYQAEWGGNFEMGESGDHAGFKKGRTIVLEYAKEYIEKYGISGDIKVWTAGYSRGAGVTNQVGAALIADPNGSLGESVNLTPGNLYCYTYGTPNSAGSPTADFGDPKDSKFDYIHNTWESYDIVTVAPPVGFGFTRYGQNFHYADRGDKDRMLDFLQQTNDVIYDLYMNGGDPDGFVPKTINLTEFLTNRKIVLEDDPESYLPEDQRAFMSMMEGSIVTAVEDRDNYATNYQPAMKDLAGYFFSHMDKASPLIDGIKNSKYSAPMVAFMYIAYMTERYTDTTFDQATKEEIQKGIEMLEATIKELEDAGEDVPAELEDQLADLKNQLNTANNWGALKDLAQAIASLLYQQVIGEGLTAAGLPDEDLALYNKLTSYEECKAITRLVSYLLLYDDMQKDDTPVISFQTLTKQMKHLATFIGNASSFMRPHNNEIILSWLRTLDSNYDDFAKENEAQKAGYRRLYIDAPEGVIVSGTVKDGEGNTVATFEDGKLLSRTDAWVGITTCDNGNWLRLPVAQTYTVDLKVNKDTTLNLKATEYLISSNEEVRTKTSDENYNWTGLEVKASDEVSWIISAVPESFYETLGSDAHYYIDILKEYTITYDLNGGELDGQTGTIQKTYKKGSVIELPAPTRTGYTFDYWEGSRYNAGDSYTVTEDHTFTAQWVKTAPAKNPDTGDHSNASVWVILLCLSAVALTTLACFRLRYRHR